MTSYSRLQAWQWGKHTCDEVHVVFKGLHLGYDVIFEAAGVAVKPVGQPMIVIICHPLPHQVGRKLCKSWPAVPQLLVSCSRQLLLSCSWLLLLSYS
jgi:hypothetical protein